MLKAILLLPLFFYPLASLEISLDIAEDNFQNYSLLTLNESFPFSCQSMVNEFDDTESILCKFSKKPRTPVQPIKNDFFTISSYVEQDNFFLEIRPIFKERLYANIFDLSHDATLFGADVKSANSWFVVGYKKKLPLLQTSKHSTKAINFPLYLDQDMIPYVGSLDIKGNPVFIKKVEDVKEYLSIKKLYKEKKYELALDKIEDVLQKYPNTLFRAELVYYKIKVYDDLKDYENVIDSAKEYLREYSSDDNIVEVLSLIAKAYAQIGQNGDADYFFDRLFSEHPNSLYTFKGYIYKGEMLEESGGNKAAINYYKKALYGTSSLEVAVDAAFHLAKILLPESAKKSEVYINKILQKDPSFFAQHFKESKDMMYEFASKARYETAAAMAKAILDAINPTYDEYEEILKDWGLWLSKTSHKKEAMEALNKYIKAFPDGDYLPAVQIAKDKLFFVVDDLNVTQKLQNYDKLIEEYRNDTIGQKALYEKAKLLLQLKHYKEVLALKEQLLQLDTQEYSDVKQMIHKAALGMMYGVLEKKNCKAVLDISQEYKITLSNEWDDEVYDCAMKGGDFTLSKSIAMKHLKSKNIAQRKGWLYRYAKIDFATGNYSEMVDVAKDLISLLDNKNTSPYKDIYRYLFDAYERLGNEQGMLDTMVDIESIYGLDYKDLDRYTSMVSLGEKRDDPNIIIKYATKVMKIQNRAKAYPQTPYVEFTLYEAYKKRNQLKKALRVIASLDTKELTKQQRAREKYLLGTVLDALGESLDAKKAYKEAIKADKESAWAKLAQTALEL